MNDDRITYTQHRQLIDGRDRPAAHAVDNVVRGVNAAEHAIRDVAAMIRSKLDETVARLSLGHSLNDLGQLTAPARQLCHHWQVLGALLTEAELASLQPAAPPAP